MIVAVPPPNVELPYHPKTSANALSDGRRTIAAIMDKHRADPSGARQHVPTNILTMEIQTKVWLEMSGAFVIGEGGLDLLSHIDRLHSLTGAAQAVGWSYRHAWGYLRNAERRLGSPLVLTSPGKGARRGTMLSPVGSDLLRRLDQARELVKMTAARHWATT